MYVRHNRIEWTRIEWNRMDTNAMRRDIFLLYYYNCSIIIVFDSLINRDACV